MEITKLSSQILSILFVSSKPVGIKEISQALETDEESVKDAVSALVGQNSNSGIIVLAHNNKLQLASNPDNSYFVKKFMAWELRERLSEAALETLAIILYRQPVSKAEIENIRGVNSQYTLRSLLIRGLIEKTGSENDKRVQHYKTTLEFIQHLGIKSERDLPDFEEITKDVQIPDQTRSS